MMKSKPKLIKNIEIINDKELMTEGIIIAMRSACARDVELN